MRDYIGTVNGFDVWVIVDPTCSPPEIVAVHVGQSPHLTEASGELKRAECTRLYGKGLWTAIESTYLAGIEIDDGAE